jgi:serine/threonine-protein kinase
VSPARWPEIRALFDELADASAGTRAARLAAADPELRGEVTALLESDADSEERLARMFAPLRIRDPLALTGRTISHFRVREPLGAGGMGVVYAADDMQLGRQVALKVPLPERHLDTSGRQRFLREARAAGSLDHPNVCGIHEVGESEHGLLFLAMPLYRGETLRARLEREGALPAELAIDIARQVARGLGAAHAAGIVHRDLKPANIMLLPDGLVKVLDFGIAKARAETLSITGGLLGTAAYMSPEQIRSDPVDERTDLWALGVVLYEMIAGSKPFVGEHDASLAHAIVNQEPEPLSARPDLPAGLPALTHALLAKDPARRPRSADEVESRLGDIAAGKPLEAAGSRRSRPLLLAGIAGLALVAALAALGGGRREAPSAGSLDANLVAIAPFDAADPDLQLWREGLVDILARDLDGAGPLRTVPPSVALSRWRGRADRPSAEGLGMRTGAGLVIFGNVVRRGADSVGIRASVLDRSRNTVDQNLEVVGAELRIGELTDSLGVEILRLLGQRRAIASARHISIGSRSFPALREFLRGEQFYRHGDVDSALAHFDAAIAGDSTFALALRRMGWVLGSGAATSWQYAPAGDYIRRAVLLNQGLSHRDSMLLRSDSLGQLSSYGGDPGAIVENTYRSVQILEELVRRYPDDPSIWYELGERYAHSSSPALGGNARALAAFDRAIALDSGFAPAYMHMPRIAFRLGGVELARKYARAYVGHGLPRSYAPDIHFVQQLLDSGGIAAPRNRERIRTAHATTLNWAANEHFRWATDSAETAVALFREILEGAHEVQGAVITADPQMQRQQLALALAFRGHLREATSVDAALLADPEASRYGYAFDPFVDLALLGTLAEPLVRQNLRPAMEVDWASGGSSSTSPRYLNALAWLASVRDTVSLLRFAERGREMESRSRNGLGRARGRYVGSAADAHLALIRGDSAGAIRLFEGIPDSLCVVAWCMPDKLVLARIFAQRGYDARAAAILERWKEAGLARPLHVIAALEHARIAERLGDRATAAREYRFVADAWQRPDTALAGMAEEARAGLRRVEADGVTGPAEKGRN